MNARAVPTTIAELKGDPDNPREISDRAKLGLRHSLEHFGDLSGIVFNRRTGELVTGHQRVEQIRQRYGDRPITPIDEGNGIYGIFVDETHYFSVRVVDWPRAMQRAANVAANNVLLHGTFTDELSDYLLAVEAELAQTLPSVLDDCLLAELLNAQDDSANDQSSQPVLASIFQVIVECADEADQRVVYERLTSEGLECKLLTV